MGVDERDLTLPDKLKTRNRSSYSVETKAAVLAALLEGQSVANVAKDYKMPLGTVSSWKNRQEKSLDNPAEFATQKKSIGEQVFKLCEEHIKAATEIAKAVQDPEYIRSQQASDVAVLLGVINDKVFRILEAFDRNNARHQDTDT
jgi:transposase-like protein